MSFVLSGSIAIIVTLRLMEMSHVKRSGQGDKVRVELLFVSTTGQQTHSQNQTKVIPCGYDVILKIQEKPN